MSLIYQPPNLKHKCGKDNAETVKFKICRRRRRFIFYSLKISLFGVR
jgi:hypothetical protein